MYSDTLKYTFCIKTGHKIYSGFNYKWNNKGQKFIFIWKPGKVT